LVRIQTGSQKKETLNESLFLFGLYISFLIYIGMKYIKKFNEKLEEKPELEEFASTRLAGAEKITNNAKEKGGLALLTWRHFKVKLPYYKKAAEGKLDLEEAKKEFNKTLKSISLDMSQTEFQTEVGRLEVLGELLIKNS
jgi:hypothetical protein